MLNDWFSLIFIITTCCSVFYIVTSVILVFLDYTTHGTDRMGLEVFWPLEIINMVLKFAIPIAVIFLACNHFLSIDFHFVSPFSITVK